MNAVISSIVMSILQSAVYDSMKSAVSYKMTGNRNVQEIVSKSVAAEFQKRTEQSRIFDSDAMKNYLEHMKPIETIYEHVFVPGKNIGNSSKNLIAGLSEKTIQYLEEQGKTVTVLDRREMTEFYESIMTICDEISRSLLSSEDIALARLLSQQSAEDQMKIVSEMKAGMRQAIDERTAGVGKMLQRIDGILTTRGDGKIAISDRRETALEDMPYKCLGGSEKIQYIRQIMSNLREYSWIHIYGKMFTGKTQVLIRAAERLASYVWLNTKRDEFFHINMADLDLQEDMVVIIDGIPNMANPAVRNKCLQILAE